MTCPLAAQENASEPGLATCLIWAGRDLCLLHKLLVCASMLSLFAASTAFNGPALRAQAVAASHVQMAALDDLKAIASEQVRTLRPHLIAIDRPRVLRPITLAACGHCLARAIFWPAWPSSEACLALSDRARSLPPPQNPVIGYWDPMNLALLNFWGQGEEATVVRATPSDEAPRCAPARGP